MASRPTGDAAKSEESEERLPLECSCVGVFDWGRDGVEERHGLRSVYWGRVK